MPAEILFAGMQGFSRVIGRVTAPPPAERLGHLFFLILAKHDHFVHVEQFRAIAWVVPKATLFLAVTMTTTENTWRAQGEAMLSEMTIRLLGTTGEHHDAS